MYIYNMCISALSTGCPQNIPLLKKKVNYRTDSDNRLYSVSSLTQLAAYFGDKKFQLFGVLIDSSAAPWHTDSKYIYMSILNIIATE